MIKVRIILFKIYGFHIWQSLEIAKSQGCKNVFGVPAKTLMPVGIHYVVREFF